MTVDTIELDDEAWAHERDAVVMKFLGLRTEEFIERFEAGEFTDVDDDGLMAVLAFFPELD